MIALTLFLTLTQAQARDWSIQISPSAGRASIANVDGYQPANYTRLDAAFFPIPEFGAGVFGISYQNFKPAGGNGTNTTINVNGSGISLTGRWIAGAHVRPYIRAEYMSWRARASALGQTLQDQNGWSPGFTLGVQFPFSRVVGAKVEMTRYNKISDANIRQFSLGLTFEF
jgi:hypothetical protein